jgi:hypothetical protein
MKLLIMSLKQTGDMTIIRGVSTERWWFDAIGGYIFVLCAVAEISDNVFLHTSLPKVTFQRQTDIFSCLLDRRNC